MAHSKKEQIELVINILWKVSSEMDCHELVLPQKKIQEIKHKKVIEKKVKDEEEKR